jgi:AcrR family transcriptional regulator
MRDTMIPDAGPKRRLVEAAEALFAEKGFEVVAVREIMQQAQTNVAAVNYHFGSREGLVNLVMLRCVGPVSEERLVRLDAVERRLVGKVIPVEEVLDAFVRPLMGQLGKSGLPERTFYRLLGRVFAASGDGLSEVVEQSLRQVNDRFIKAFGKALPSLGEDELLARVHFMNGGMVRLLMHHGQPGGAAAGGAAMELTLARFVRFAVAGLRDGVEDAEEDDGPQGFFDF